MEYKNIEIINDGEGNTIHIEKGTPFTSSRIYIKGNNNQVLISKANSISNLFINFKGNNK